MRQNDIHNLIDRLQGFDGDELQREMTDGLDLWCRRRKQQGRVVKRTLLLALLLLTTTAIAMTVVPMLRSAREATEQAVAPTPAPLPSPTPAEEPLAVDSVVVKPLSHKPVDYYYTGVSEEGYSVTYGHDSRTLTYTRYSGNHLIHSVVYDSPDIFMNGDQEEQEDCSSSSQGIPVDQADNSLNSLNSLNSPKPPQIACDFQTVNSQGDALYYEIIDSVRGEVSVRGDVARWMGQPIRYSAVLTLPASVEHEGRHYTVTTLADSAFMGHDELEAVCLPPTVTRVGDYAFAGCCALESLTVQAAVPPEAFPASFDRVDARLTLTVPCGSARAYANDAEWLYFRRLGEDCTHATPRIRVIRKP